MLDEHLQLGDSRAACVILTDPLLVAAYTDELDCVALLKFSAGLVAEHNLKSGDRLLTVNTYSRDQQIAPDLQAGPLQSGRYSNFYPVIAEFVSDDVMRITERKAEIGEDEWARCETMGRESLRKGPDGWRNGSPLWSAEPTPEGEIPRQPVLDHSQALPSDSNPASSPVTLLPAAVAAIRQMLETSDRPIWVRMEIHLPGGPETLRHALDLDSNLPGAQDREFVSGGLPVVVLADQVEMLRGCTVDYGQAAGQAGFKIKNPNFEGGHAWIWLERLRRRREG
jgi:Fe-S cluster assembly iron-binding protein IscA